MAAKGHELGGFGEVVLLALGFGIGMVLADTANGWLTHTLVRRSEHMAHQVGRWMSGVVGVLALAVVLLAQTALPLVGSFRGHAGWVALAGTVALMLSGLAKFVAAHKGARVFAGHGVAGPVVGLLGMLNIALAAYFEYAEYQFKPAGTTWSRNRRMNSSTGSVMTFTPPAIDVQLVELKTLAILALVLLAALEPIRPA
jgi:hypothetical protein